MSSVDESFTLNTCQSFRAPWAVEKTQRSFVGGTMNVLEEVSFQTPLGPLQEDVQMVMAPDVTVPDCHQILRETEYAFNLEKLILTGRQPVCQTPSCPPYWMLFSSPQEGHRPGCRSSDLLAPSLRPRSLSLNSADARWLCHRTVTFLVSDSEDEDGYCVDNEGSSTEDGPDTVRSRERPRSAAPKVPPSRVRDSHRGLPPHHCKPDSPASLRAHRGSVSALQEGRQPLQALEPQRSQQVNVAPHGQKNGKKRQRPLVSAGRKFTQHPLPACRLQQQQRPSSAGPVFKKRRQKVLRSSSTRGVFFDSATELLSALSWEERELLQTITDRGYALHTAILALQKTGYRSPEKILKYLVASDRLCELGYDEAQVEEALEMFQNCETKAAEFLRLLTQFNEMGFQQSAIKEVLLVHENHRERALEELMTRMA